MTDSTPARPTITMPQLDGMYWIMLVSRILPHPGRDHPRRRPVLHSIRRLAGERAARHGAGRSILRRPPRRLGQVGRHRHGAAADHRPFGTTCRSSSSTNELASSYHMIAGLKMLAGDRASFCSPRSWPAEPPPPTHPPKVAIVAQRLPCPRPGHRHPRQRAAVVSHAPQSRRRRPPQLIAPANAPCLDNSRYDHPTPDNHCPWTKKPKNASTCCARKSTTSSSAWPARASKWTIAGEVRQLETDLAAAKARNRKTQKVVGVYRAI